jgi:hypothetical protein
MPERSVTKAVRLPVEAVERIAIQVRLYQESVPYINISESDTLRLIFLRGLETLEREQTPIVVAEEVPLQTEPTQKTPPVRRHVRKTAPATDDSEASGEDGYDTSKFYLGPLCKYGHDHNGTRQSVRRLNGRQCRQCLREFNRRYEEKKRHAARATAKQATQEVAS